MTSTIIVKAISIFRGSISNLPIATNIICAKGAQLTVYCRTALGRAQRTTLEFSKKNPIPLAVYLRIKVLPQSRTFRI